MSSSPHHAQTSSNDGNIYVFVHGSDEERPAEEGECSLSDSEAQQQGGEVFRDHNTANSSRHSSVSLEDMMIPSLKTSLSEDNETDDTCEVSASSSEEECLPEEHHEHPDDPEQTPNAWLHDVVWLTICFVGIMTSFVAYGILLEYTTSGDKRLAELPFLLITSILGSITAYTGRSLKKETVADIPHRSTLLLGLMSLGSTFCAIRALRYVIFPIQVLARSCKPVPVMLIGAMLGKKYPARKYLNVLFIVIGVALFMGGGKMTNDDEDNSNGDELAMTFNNTTAEYYSFYSDNSNEEEDNSNMDYYTMFSNPHHLLDRAPLQHSHEVLVEGEEPVTMDKQILGVLLLLASLCFDGGTGAYEDKLMSVQKVEPFDLMFKFQASKTILSAVAVLLLGEVPALVEMLRDTGIYIFALGMCSAIGQVFIFICISKFGALTTSLMSLTRKVTTLTASIVIFGHGLAAMQIVGLAVSLGAMIMNAFKPKKKEDDSTIPPTRIPSSDKSVKATEELQPIV